MSVDSIIASRLYMKKPRPRELSNQPESHTF